MKHAKIIPSKLAHSQQSNSFRTSATLILTTLLLLIAASTTAATAQTYTDLFNFNGTDGANPNTPPFLPRDETATYTGQRAEAELAARASCSRSHQAVTNSAIQL